MPVRFFLVALALVPSAAPASRFDPDQAGTVTGQIRWAAPLPHAEPLPGERLPIDGKTSAIRHVPNLPAIDDLRRPRISPRS